MKSVHIWRKDSRNLTLFQPPGKRAIPTTRRENFPATSRLSLVTILASLTQPSQVLYVATFLSPRSPPLCFDLKQPLFTRTRRRFSLRADVTDDGAKGGAGMWGARRERVSVHVLKGTAIGCLPIGFSTAVYGNAAVSMQWSIDGARFSRISCILF